MTDKRPMKDMQKYYASLEKEWDFEALIEPYREGGTPDEPIRRTWGTLCDWLVNKRRYPPDVVGAAIFLVWMQIKKLGPFTGDGTYGSSGREFASAIRVTCDGILNQRLTDKVFNGMAENIEAKLKLYFTGEVYKAIPWFVKMFSRKYWQHRSWRKKQTVEKVPVKRMDV